MPMPFNAAVMTNDGAALLNKAQAGECSIAFTAMAIGDGVYTEEEKSVSALQTMTELKSMKNKYYDTKVAVNTETSVKVTAVLSNEDPSTGEAVVINGYYINEIGLYAKEKDGGDDTEILYSIAVTSGDEGDYMPPYNGYNPAEIEQSYYATVDNSANVTLVVHNEIYALQDDVDERFEECDVKIDDLAKITAEPYNGRDLTEIFADEIAQYEDAWHWVKARCNAGDFSGLRNSDYIPLEVDGETYEMMMNIDVYYGTTDEVLGHHIDFISRHCIPTSVQWNTTDTNNGNAESPYPYMVGNLKDWLDNTMYPKLPDGLKSVITNKRMLLEQRYSASGTLTDSTVRGWCDMGPLWALTEWEVSGSVCLATLYYGSGQNIQYPIFTNTGWKNLLKRAGANGSYCAWWLACAWSGSSVSACRVAADGALSTATASARSYVPLCFRIAADAA